MFRLDHIVILVRDLAAAAFDYGGMGFQVVYGGEHDSGGTHNALVPLADGTYLELIAYREQAPAGTGHEQRIAGWKRRGEGLVDFALVPDDLDAVMRDAAGRGLRLCGPMPGGRARPDGARIAWKLALPDTLDLPFLCADVTPRSMRVPGGLATVQDNGVCGIHRLVVGVESLPESVERYRALLGAGPRPDGRSFAVGGGFIHLQPAYRNPGLLEVELRAAPAAAAGPLPARHAHGAAISIVVERHAP